MSSTSAARTSPERLDRVFRALADRTRRALLARLARGPAPIGELARPFDMSFAAVSKHLRVLEDAKLVERTIDGRVHRCALDAGPLRDADAWLAHYREYWDGTLSSLEAHFRRGKKAR
jgi:DNA-binding transcriptional ArsR family regulator